MRYLWLIISPGLLVACSTYVMPDAAQIPWQYPHLSTTGCPDLTGIYKLDKNYYFLAEESIYDKNFKKRADFFEIKQHTDGIDIRFWNAQQEKIIFTKIGGLEFGCIDGKLIEHNYNSDVSGGGEVPRNPYIDYREGIVVKLDDGNLDVTYSYNTFVKNISGAKITPFNRHHFTVQRIKKVLIK